MIIKYEIKFIFILIYFFLSIFFIIKDTNDSIEINISEGFSEKHQKFWVGEKYKIKIVKSIYKKNEKIILNNSRTNKTELLKGYIIMKSSGRECLTASLLKINSTICFKIYSTPDLNFKDKDPINLEVNRNKQLNLDIKDYPLANIKYKSNNPGTVKVNVKGKITALKPGKAIITALGLDNKNIKINVMVISKNGLVNKNLLDKYNASQYKKVMIVAHPDDETLWGGANLIRDKYFIICFTNGYNLERSNDFREILKFTNNSGIILNYPDRLNNITDDWSEVKYGILKDLSTILTYKNWEKIVTHGPDGTTGHIHHRKISEYVTETSKKYNKYNNLYYFGKFYKFNQIPKNLPRISDIEYEYKKKEVEIHKHEKKIIYVRWFHMLPYENWILATKWKKS